MATKAIYTNIGGKYYRVNQDTRNPDEVVRLQRTHSQMNTDESCKVINSNIWINTLDTDLIFSNRELYKKMLDDITRCKITDIPVIQNHYVMYCDYSVFNLNGKEINHNAFTRPIMARDAIYNLGVDRESELIYKQVKVFDTDILLNVKNEYPMGIMKNTSNVKYSLQINDVSIYQDLKHSECDIHKSSDPNSYPISTVLESMVKVYSTHDNGVVISAVEVPFIPKKIMLNMNIILDDIIVVYDNNEVKNLINKNNGVDDKPQNPGQILIFNGGTATTVR